MKMKMKMKTQRGAVGESLPKQLRGRNASAKPMHFHPDAPVISNFHA